MRLVTFRREAEIHIGALTVRGIVDFAQAAPALPQSMLGLLAAGPPALTTARAVVARALDDGVGLRTSETMQLLAPLPRPGKIFGVGFNYRAHAAETGNQAPQTPRIFSKAVTAVIGPGDAIEIPPVSACIDYEGELALVIGQRAKRVRRNEALAYVAGYTIMNDVTARDVQQRSGNSIAKSFDTFAPMGPWLVTTEELPEPGHLTIRTVVNGETRQDANTSELIFDIAALIEFISAGVTLEPGDLITTGTPAGVGARRTPPSFLQPGDSVRVEISGIGALENPVVAA